MHYVTGNVQAEKVAFLLLNVVGVKFPIPSMHQYYETPQGLNVCVNEMTEVSLRKYTAANFAGSVI